MGVGLRCHCEDAAREQGLRARQQKLQWQLARQAGRNYSRADPNCRLDRQAANRFGLSAAGAFAESRIQARTGALTSPSFCKASAAMSCRRIFSTISLAVSPKATSIFAN